MTKPDKKALSKSAAEVKAATQEVLGDGQHSIAPEDGALHLQVEFLEYCANIYELQSRGVDDEVLKDFILHSYKAFEASYRLLGLDLDPVAEELAVDGNKYKNTPIAEYIYNLMLDVTNHRSRVVYTYENNKDKVQKELSRKQRYDRLKRFAEGILDDPCEQSPKVFMNPTFNNKYGVWHLRRGFRYPRALYVSLRDHKGNFDGFVYNINDKPIFVLPYQNLKIDPFIDDNPKENPWDEDTIRSWPVKHPAR